MREKAVIVAVLVCTFLPSFALAHDLIVPPWRGQSGTTHQEWRFDDADNPAAPEAMYNPYGDAVANITVGNFGSGWLDQLPAMGEQTGYWDIGGQGGRIVIDIPNRPMPLPYKEVWVQITYYMDITRAPNVDVPGAFYSDGQTVLVEQVPTGGAWLLDQSIWRIEPNPNSEQIIITTNPLWGAVIDQIVVDTICFPEPGSLALAGLGGLLLIRRKYR